MTSLCKTQELQKSQTVFVQDMTKESRNDHTKEVAFVNGEESKIYGTTHYPHGWLGLNASFSNEAPTIDAGIWKHHTLLIEETKIQPTEVGYIENGTGKHQSNTVYDPKGSSPTITTITGGGTQQIKIVDVKKLGFIDKGTGEHESNIVYDSNGVSPCVTASFGVKQPPTMSIEVQKI